MQFKIMKRKKPPSENFIFISSILNLWLIAGLYIDGWSHEHGKPLTSFFTPWHAIFYAGFFAVSIHLFYQTLINFRHTKKLKFVYPSYFGPAISGVIIFGLGGLGDVAWHGFYGFEKQIDAILSPTHLALYIGMFLIFSANLMSLLNQTFRNFFKYKVSLILSMTIIFSFFTFLTQFANPLISPFAFSSHRTGVFYYGQTIGLVSLFLHTIFFMAPLILVLMHKKLPIGTLTIMFTLNALGMTAIHDHFDFIISSVLAGVIGDLILYYLKPSFNNSVRLQFFSFLIPAVYSGSYFLIGFLARGIWWSGYLWMGAILLVGFFGWVIAALLLAAQNKKTI